MRKIRNLEDLNTFGGKNVTIHVETDRDNRAAKISIDNSEVHTGHLWEFHPAACGGGWFYDLAMSYGGFSSVKMMVTSLNKALSDLGARCSFKESNMSLMSSEPVFEEAMAPSYSI